MAFSEDNSALVVVILCIIHVKKPIKIRVYNGKIIILVVFMSVYLSDVLNITKYIKN